jgi:hypothetical protein
MCDKGSSNMRQRSRSHMRAGRKGKQRELGAEGDGR